MGLPIVCLGALNVELLYRVENLDLFLAARPLLQPGGEIAQDPGEESRLLPLLSRRAGK